MAEKKKYIIKQWKFETAIIEASSIDTVREILEVAPGGFAWNQHDSQTKLSIMEASPGEIDLHLKP